MALRETQPEPSMEEILASIRRIISEEGAPAEAAGEPINLSNEAPAGAAEAGVDDLLVFEDADDDVEFEDAPVQNTAFTPAAAPATVAAAPAADGLVSDPAAAATAGAFTRLAGSLRIAEAQGQTLEGVVRELLRPMLRDWLDQNLPKIVEAKVEAELDRITRLVR